MKRIKQKYKISKKGNKIMPSGPYGGDRPAFWRKKGWRKQEIQKKGESSKGGKHWTNNSVTLIFGKCDHCLFTIWT